MAAHVGVLFAIHYCITIALTLTLLLEKETGRTVDFILELNLS